MKNIKRTAAALCAGLALNIAFAAEPQDTLRSQFEAAAGAPASTHSLYTPSAEPVARELFARNDVVIIGEIHHNTNIKFLADNPAFFREAARNGVKSIYIELPVQMLPATEDYFADRLSEADFNAIMIEHFKNVWLQWGSGNNRDYAQQYIALCKTAKDHGVKIVPTDFRLVKDIITTTDMYGIPDIEGRDDIVRTLTLKTANLYTTETGKSRPITSDEQTVFRKLYQRLSEELPDDEKEILRLTRSERLAIWNSHNENNSTMAAYQNELQARYIARTPHEKKIAFIGGSHHFYQNGSIGDYAHTNGYRKIAGIELIARNGDLWRQGLEDMNSLKARQNGHQYQVRIHTDLGEVIRLSPPDVKLAQEKSPGF
jgi:hypothetical protein